MIHWFTTRGVLCGEFYGLSEADRGAALVVADRAAVTCPGCLAVIPADDPGIAAVRDVVAEVFDRAARKAGP